MGDVTTLASHGLSRRGGGRGAGSAGGPERSEGHRGPGGGKGRAGLRGARHREPEGQAPALMAGQGGRSAPL